MCGALRANLAASRAFGVALAAIEAVAREASAEGRAELRVTLAPMLTEAMHTTVRAAHLERLVLLVAPPVGGVAAAPRCRKRQSKGRPGAQDQEGPALPCGRLEVLKPHQHPTIHTSD